MHRGGAHDALLAIGDASQGGHDTHVAQADSHRNLLGEFSAAMKAFLDDLKTSQLAERIVVLAFSEFGRRVQGTGQQGPITELSGPFSSLGAMCREDFLENIRHSATWIREISRCRSTSDAFMRRF
jgi:hypothetical protein